MKLSSASQLILFRHVKSSLERTSLLNVIPRLNNFVSFVNLRNRHFHFSINLMNPTPGIASNDPDTTGWPPTKITLNIYLENNSHVRANKFCPTSSNRYSAPESTNLSFCPMFQTSSKYKNFKPFHTIPHVRSQFTCPPFVIDTAIIRRVPPPPTAIDTNCNFSQSRIETNRS